ncbi:hypothetical protein TorRG33x02_093530 [Trema orientale]|uniref:Uncharacterized protein n=1 Tax=Trema orientale TaxID=63057 RepID=A0A2P5FAM6_TREOI|nr:hypothetical protein TorRG33x02_093530 [Trema orientale]
MVVSLFSSFSSSMCQALLRVKKKVSLSWIFTGFLHDSLGLTVSMLWCTFECIWIETEDGEEVGPFTVC